MKRILIKRPRILPQKTKKVFHGVIFDIYQWKQKMYDGSLKTFEMLKRKDTVVIIPITINNKIVVLKQEQPNRKPFMSFPGGRVDDAQNIDLEALRELREESGYEPRTMKLWKSHQVSNKIDSIGYFFIAQGCEKISEPAPDSDGEKITVHTFTFQEFLQLVFKKSFRRAFIIEDMLHAYYDKKHRDRLKKLFFT